MILSPRISLSEMAAILRTALAEKLGHEIGDITVTSFGTVRIHIGADDMVECDAFRHRAAGN